MQLHGRQGKAFLPSGSYNQGVGFDYGQRTNGIPIPRLLTEVSFFVPPNRFGRKGNPPLCIPGWFSLLALITRKMPR